MREMGENGDESDLDHDRKMDPEPVSCLLQPQIAYHDLNYVGIRRLLLSRKPQIHERKDWRCNGRGYVAYRNFIWRPRNWESMIARSQSSMPGHSGHGASPPLPQSILFDADSGSSSRDLRSVNNSFGHRSSFSSTTDDVDRQVQFVEPAYSFV